MKRFKLITAIIFAFVLLTGTLTACTDNEFRTDLSKEENIKFDMVKVMENVRVADGFFSTYASVIPSVFVEEKWDLTYEMGEKDGKEVYIAVVSGEYYPDYRDHDSTKTGTIKFMMDLTETNKSKRAKAPWPYEDPDNIDDIIWQFVTHKDPSER